jgi:hypothetical protein
MKILKCNILVDELPKDCDFCDFESEKCICLLNGKKSSMGDRRLANCPLEASRSYAVIYFGLGLARIEKIIHEDRYFQVKDKNGQMRYPIVGDDFDLDGIIVHIDDEAGCYAYKRLNDL